MKTENVNGQIGLRNRYLPLSAPIISSLGRELCWCCRQKTLEIGDQLTEGTGQNGKVQLQFTGGRRTVKLYETCTVKLYCRPVLWNFTVDLYFKTLL